MEFDKDDVVQAMINDGTFQTVITQEMGHILGLGSLWQQKGLVVSDGNGGYVYSLIEIKSQSQRDQCMFTTNTQVNIATCV